MAAVTEKGLISGPACTDLSLTDTPSRTYLPARCAKKLRISLSIHPPRVTGSSIRLRTMLATCGSIEANVGSQQAEGRDSRVRCTPADMAAWALLCFLVRRTSSARTAWVVDAGLGRALACGAHNSRQWHNHQKVLAHSLSASRQEGCVWHVEDATSNRKGGCQSVSTQHFQWEVRKSQNIHQQQTRHTATAYTQMRHSYARQHVKGVRMCLEDASNHKKCGP